MGAVSRSRSSQIALISLCSALYAVAKAATAFIPTPWGVGQFAPGVVVPAYFAVVGGPYVAAIGAAIGVFVGDLYLFTFGLTNPWLSLIAGVPGNFIGIFLMGWLLQRFKSWRSFIASSLTGVFAGNLVAAVGVVGFLSLLPAGLFPLAGLWSTLSTDVLVAATLGFTLFWMVTMIPFVLLLVPLILRATKPLGARGSLTFPDWNHEEPKTLLPVSLAGAAVFAVIFLVTFITPAGDALFSQVIRPDVAILTKLLVLVASISILALGPIVSVLASSKLISQ